MFEDLVEPAKLLVGKGLSKIPINNSSAVLEKFGESKLNEILQLKKVFFESNSYIKNGDRIDWDDIYKNVKLDFEKKYPNCCKELIDIFWWSYSFALWKDGVV